MKVAQIPAQRLAHSAKVDIYVFVLRLWYTYRQDALQWWYLFQVTLSSLTLKVLIFIEII